MGVRAGRASCQRYRGRIARTTYLPLSGCDGQTAYSPLKPAPTLAPNNYHPGTHSMGAEGPISPKKRASRIDGTPFHCHGFVVSTMDTTFIP